MAINQFRDDNAFVHFIDSEGWDHSIRKSNISLRVDQRNQTVAVYDGREKWFELSPGQLIEPIVEDVDELRKVLEDIADENQALQKRSTFYTLFGRLKISQEQFIFENRFEYDTEPRFWDVVENVNGTINFNASNNSVGLQIGTAQGDKLIRQTRTFFRYTAGKLQRGKFGVLFEPQKIGLRQRCGLFNELDGFYIEENENGEFEIVRRSNATGVVVEERIPQDEWNEDRFDGLGKSRQTLDFSKIQMISIEFSWYGAGGCNLGLVVAGETFVAHHFDAGNRLDNALIGRPLLPLRFEIENVAETASPSDQRQFGSTISDDGGTGESKGRIFIAENAEEVDVNINEFLPILTIRPKLLVNGIDNRTSVLVVSTEILTELSEAEFQVIHDGTLTGASFVDQNDFIEKDVSATAVSFVSKDVVGGGFISGGRKEQNIDSEGISVRFPFTINHDATEANQITIAVRAISANNGTAKALIKGLIQF